MWKKIFILLGFPKQIFAINLFQKKMPFTSGTSTTEKDTEYRSETKNITFFWWNVCFVSENIGNSQTILRKIHFHIKVIKAWTACLFYQ